MTPCSSYVGGLVFSLPLLSGAGDGEGGEEDLQLDLEEGRGRQGGRRPLLQAPLPRRRRRRRHA